jgi:cyclic patellamide precursor peptide PatG
MEQPEASQEAEEQSPPPPIDETASTAPAAADPTPVAPPPGTPQPDYVYAIGRIEPRLPSLAVEKEFAQVIGRGDNAGLTDREALQRAVSDRANRYLARRLCWVFLVEGLETYLLIPRDPADLDLLIEAVRTEPGAADLDVIVGQRGPIAPPELCGGLTIPIAVFDQVWSFPRDALLAAIPRPKGTKEDKRFQQMASELFDRVMQLADNAGATDEHRALNYLAVRDPSIYERTAEAYAGNASLSSVDVRPSRLAGVRNIVDVIFSYTHRETDVTEKSFVRVDVTEEFPFLVSRLAPYYDR